MGKRTLVLARRLSALAWGFGGAFFAIPSDGGGMLGCCPVLVIVVTGGGGGLGTSAMDVTGGGGGVGTSAMDAAIAGVGLCKRFGAVALVSRGGNVDGMPSEEWFESVV